MCEKSRMSKIHLNSQKLWPNSFRNQTSHPQKLDQMSIYIITLTLEQKDLRIVH